MSSSLFFLLCFCFFFSYPATTEIYTLSLHDALPISLLMNALIDLVAQSHDWWGLFSLGLNVGYDNKDFFWSDMLHYRKDRKSTRLNSSHTVISYAVFCLKKKKNRRLVSHSKVWVT